MLIAEGAAVLVVLAALSYTGYNYRLARRYRYGRGGLAGSATSRLNSADKKISTIQSAVADKHAEVGKVHESLDDLESSLGT